MGNRGAKRDLSLAAAKKAFPQYTVTSDEAQATGHGGRGTERATEETFTGHVGQPCLPSGPDWKGRQWRH